MARRLLARCQVEAPACSHPRNAHEETDLIFVGTLTADRLSLPVRGESHQGLDGDWFGTLTSSTQNTPALRTGPATLTLKDGTIWDIVVAATGRVCEYCRPKSYFRIDQMHSDRNGPHARTFS